MDVTEEELLEKKSGSDSGSEGSEDEEHCEITDSEEQEPVRANISALDTWIARGQKHDALDNTTFSY